MARTKQDPKKIGTPSATRGKPSTSFAPQRRQRPHRYRPGTVALREIRKYQASVNTLIPKLSFQRLVHEILMNISRIDLKDEMYRIQAEAVSALQVSI